jgi:hypothetical protein
MCTVLAKCAVCYFGQKPFSNASIGDADHQAFEFQRSMFRTQPLENCEGSNLSLQIFYHDVDHTRIGKHSQVLFFRPRTNQRTKLGKPLQRANLWDVCSGRVSKPHLKRLLCAFFLPATNRRVAHISLVFREMWDTTDLDRYMPRAHRESDGKSSGIPHLAKNERDVGHPSFVREPGALVIVPVFDQAGKRVIGTIDVESEEPNAFTKDIEALLEACSKVIRPLWDHPH